MTAAQIFATPAMQQVLQQVTDKLKITDMNTSNKSNDAPRKLNPLEQRILDDWSALPKLPMFQIAMADVEGTIMDFTDYRIFRINEYLNAE